MSQVEDILAQDFGTLAEVVHLHAVEEPGRIAFVVGEARLSYGDLDALMDRVAGKLQAEGLLPGDRIAICAATSIDYAAIFLGALRAGVAVAPIAPSSTPEQIVAMIADSGAPILFADGQVVETLDGVALAARTVVRLDQSDKLAEWLSDHAPALVQVDPAAPFHIIYSSGTTGTPKGIVQSHRMRWGHVTGGAKLGYTTRSVTLLSTPLYSNTTMASFMPAIGAGGTIVMMPKFDAAAYLKLAETHRMTHTMLVPVQYRRIMALPDFEAHDLSSTVMKFATSAPFPAELKADVLARWPGGLVEYFGMTEGGGVCVLLAHLFPDKLHTVGRPAPGHDMRVLGEDGSELPAGEIGEVVGHSAATMNGYHNRPDQTEAAMWTAPDGRRFMRTGDVGRFDADGFLTLMDRKKDMIISGGYNIYPSDIEAILTAHPDVVEAAVVGIPSNAWGETPVAFLALRSGDGETVRDWANAQLGKTQRLSGVAVVEALPRSAIGKVLKRELRDSWAG
ncbi:class I adenylate-forming enzyme family protein [Glacieibacterium sp.]|uniref:class I adenylate-forming enzyme family protein n=1 Tax=Glacieibacterium sp. TaxID=2860237 RepID=UPI003B007C22